MTRRPLIWTLGIALLGISTQAFQCGSPEFTGAKVYEQQKNWKEAVRLFEQETQKNPTNAEAWYRLGTIRGMYLNDDAGMVVALTEAVKHDKKFEHDAHLVQYSRWATHVNNGVSDLKRGVDTASYLPRAVEDFKSAIVAWPDTSVTYEYLGHAYMNIRDDENAIDAYTKAWTMGKDKDSYKRAGAIHIQHALLLMSKFDSVNAVSLKNVKNLAEIDRGSYENDVLRLFGPPDAKKRDAKNAKIETWTYNQYGLVLTLDNKKVTKKVFAKPYTASFDSTAWRAGAAEYNKAVLVFEEIKKADQKDNENLKFLLQAYVGANRIAEATAAFKLAVDNDPTNKTNHFILGVLYRTIGDFTSAINEYKEAAKIDPEFVDALFELGATYFNWGLDIRKSAQDKGEDDPTYKEKFKAALPYLEKVSEIKKDDAGVFRTLAAIYASMGESAKAMKALDEADNIAKSK